MKLKDYARDWLAYAASFRAASTITRYRTALNALAAGLGDCELADVKPAAVKAWHGARAGVVAPATLAVDTVVVQRLFRSAVKEELLPTDPTEALDRVPVDRQAKALDATWAGAHQAVSEHADEPYRAALLLILQSGVRIGELLHLRWQDVTEGGLDVRPHDGWKPKSSASCRRIPQTAEAVECLSVLKGCARNGYVCDMRSQAEKHLRQALARACEAAGIAPLKVHDLRHLFITHHAEINTHIEVVRKLAGHASVTTTQRYFHLQERSLVEAMERFK